MTADETMSPGDNLAGKDYSAAEEALIRAEFDAEFYHARYPDVAQLAPDPFLYFLREGWKENQNPNEWFSTADYLIVNEDVRASAANPFAHYVLYGRAEKRDLQRSVPAEPQPETTDPAGLPQAGADSEAAGEGSGYSAAEEARIRAEFDAEFYLARYPSVAQLAPDPFQHFLREGWKQNQDPNDWFSTADYLMANEDVRASAANPFAHYILYGQTEKRDLQRFVPAEPQPQATDPAGFAQTSADREAAGEGSGYSAAEEARIRAEFDAEFYLARYPGVAQLAPDPFLYFLREGWKQNQDPNEWFSTADYLMANEDVRASTANPFAHYILYGQTEKRDLHRLARTEARPEATGPAGLLQTSADSEAAGEGSGYSATEEAQVRAQFDIEFYLARYPDVARLAPDPFLYFLREGWKQNQDPNEWFSTADYLMANEDVRASTANPFAHYILYGQTEKRALKLTTKKSTAAQINRVYEVIKPEFDVEYYLTTNPQLRDTGVDPIRHFITSGWQQGRNPNPKFVTKYYLESNPDVRKARINPFYHYVSSGRAEGRLPSPAGKGERVVLFTDVLAGPRQPLSAAGDNAPTTIVVPIYNNFDDLLTLLPSLHETLDETTNVIFVNDCSPDERILPELSSWAGRHERWRVVTNERNLGFADSVNCGIRLSEGHVVVANSDVVFPKRWLERLLAPIHQHPDEIGSVTPFSNHSSFTGFPRARSEVALENPGELELIDRAFRTLTPIYLDVPAGIGFCMAMNRAAIDKVGLLDGESYGRGYYEDTDWCQRVASGGYRNVVCGNLFIHHKVGSKSFSVGARNELSATNRQIFLSKFPHYDLAERHYYEVDPLYEIRMAAETLVWRHQAKSAHLVIDHSWGGGANDFSRRTLDQLLADGAFVIYLTLNKEKYLMRIEYADKVMEIEQLYSAEIWRVAEHFAIERIILNGVHGALRVQDVLKEVATLADGRALTVYIHDFLAVCPTIFLLGDGFKHCGVPDLTTCQSCFVSNWNIKYEAFSIVEWRRAWRHVLSRAKEINVFSQSSKDLLLRGFPDLQGPTVNVVDPSYPVDLPVVRQPPPSSTLRIAVVGSMRPHKGSRLVLHLANYLDNNMIAASITVIGTWHDIDHPKTMKVVGAYQVANLANILENENIDVVLFPSVCPETYSATLSEIFATRLPVVSLALGAQGERVARYEFGDIAADTDPASVIAALRRAFRKRWSPQSREKDHAA